MRTIYYIAKTELQTLFYSPIAWMIIIIFVFQAGMSFSDSFADTVRIQSMLNRDTSGLTGALFSESSGLFIRILSSLYLYIPLLTMGLMSREYNSGSIKLLYNAPITNVQIILGKYLCTVIYGLVLVALLAVFVIFAGIKIPFFDWGLCLTGLLGIYLLICVYSAIGLFMSSLTSYQLVAAICTLSVLAVLNYVGNLWQNMDFVRDLTYWLSISGRAQTFIHGLICSEDVLYFLILIALFLSWTIIQLQSARQKCRWGVIWSKFLSLFMIVMFLGYLTSRPKLMFFFDTTQTKSESLVPEAQKMINDLEGGLTITTYGNLMTNEFAYVSSWHINEDLENFKQYMRYKPEIDTKYVYYYPTGSDMEDVRFNAEFMLEDLDKIHSSDQLDLPIDSLAEGIGIIRVFERENGQKEILPIYNDASMFPREADYMTMFRRFLQKSPKIGFLTGHGERSIYKTGERDYRLFARQRSFRQSLLNTGLDPYELKLDQEVPEDVQVLVIGDMRGQLTNVEKENLQKYIVRGGNLFITVEPRHSKDIDSLLMVFGVDIVPGTLVRPNEHMNADIIFSVAVPDESEELTGMISEMEGFIAGTTCCGLEHTANTGYRAIPLFVTAGRGVWNELETVNLVEDTIRLNPKAGEVEKSYITGMALTRPVKDKQQKIVVFGNADYFSNLGIQYKAEEDAINLYAMTASFNWLTDGYAPILVERPSLPDGHINMTRNASKWLGFTFMGVYPGILLLLALWLGFRRKRK